MLFFRGTYLLDKEEKKQESAIQEEDPNAHVKVQEAMSLADKLLERLKTINVEEAIDLMANVLCELQSKYPQKIL